MIHVEADETVRIERAERARFERYCAPGENDCIQWVGTANEDGYGRLRFRGVILAAHRIAWLLEREEPIAGRHVLHRCDNPGCVNPDHLFLGTQFDNMRDMVAKGRQAKSFVGHKNPKAALSDDDVRTIRQRLDHGERGTDVARAYGVTRQTIYAIGTRRTWQHVV